jgi:hypothetical protein
VSTLRQALGQIEPHVSLKAAWKRVIQLSRRLRKEGHPTQLHDRATVERLLARSAVAGMDLSALKVALSHLIQATETDQEDTTALAIEAWANSWTAEYASGDIEVQVHQPGGLITEAQIDRWLGTVDGRITLDVDAAATWVHHLGGLGLGGAPLMVDVHLRPGQSLPAVRRNQRNRERSYESKAWLPHLDTEGHFSATPRCIAERHGALLSAPKKMVIDPFCGAGSDAIAAAWAGANVIAGDQASARVALARQNALHFGVQKHIEFQCIDAITLLTDGLKSHPGATLFLDPPWGGVNWDRDGMNFEVLFGPWSELVPLVALAGRVILKLPRTFDLSTLDSFGRSWAIEIGLGPATDHRADRARCLTAYSDSPGRTPFISA